jgi:hypothetical protein
MGRPSDVGDGAPSPSTSSNGRRKLPAAGAHSFHLRIWPQVGDGAPEDSVWRGYVADLKGGNTRYFDDGDKLARILWEAARARFPGLGSRED